jgi:protein TonB
MELGSAGAPESAATSRDEVAILTTDAQLLDALREAVPQLALLGAGSVGELARLLGVHPCRALAIDFATIGNGGIGMLERLAALFPELPLVVIGAPNDEPFVTPLIDRGIVWRFLAKPPGREPAATVLVVAVRLGRERALGVDPADDEEDDLDDDDDERRDEDPDEDEDEEEDDEETPARAPAGRPVLRGNPGSRTEPAHGPSRARVAAAAPPAARRQPLVRWPALPKSTWVAVAGAALLGGLALALSMRPGPAPTAAIPAAVLEPAAPERRSAVERAPPGAATLVAAGDLALARGALVAPLGTSAVDYYRRAVALDPDNAAARTGLTAVADALLRDADAALTDGRLGEAESAVRAAGLAHPEDPRVPAMLARVQQAGTRATGARGNAPRADSPQARVGAAAPRAAGVAARGDDSSAAAPNAAAASRSSPATVASVATVPSDAAAGATPRAAAPGTAPSDGNAAARDATVPAGRGPDVAAEAPLRRIAGAEPRYPLRARTNGVTGWVDVEFTVDAQGAPRDVRVVRAQPERVFDDAARRAVSTWRYAPPDRPRNASVRLRFDLED